MAQQAIIKRLWRLSIWVDCSNTFWSELVLFFGDKDRVSNEQLSTHCRDDITLNKAYKHVYMPLDHVEAFSPFKPSAHVLALSPCSIALSFSFFLFLPDSPNCEKAGTREKSCCFSNVTLSCDTVNKSRTVSWAFCIMIPCHCIVIWLFVTFLVQTLLKNGSCIQKYHI